MSPPAITKNGMAISVNESTPFSICCPMIINLRPLSMFAAKVYQDDPCTRFMPKILDENIYDAVTRAG